MEASSSSADKIQLLLQQKHQVGIGPLNSVQIGADRKIKPLFLLAKPLGASSLVIPPQNRTKQ